MTCSGVKVPLTQGLFAVVSECDAERVLSRTWHAITGAGKPSYAGSSTGVRGTAPHLLHRFIMEPPKGLVVDHINGDGLDNRRENLRFASHRQNIRNQRVQATGRKTSRFKGVSADPGRTMPWRAEIKQNGVRLKLGGFATEEGAAKAYDAAAKVLHGRFAKTNQEMGLL